MKEEEIRLIAEAFSYSQPRFDNTSEYDTWRAVLNAVTANIARIHPKFNTMQFQYMASEPWRGEVKLP